MNYNDLSFKELIPHIQKLVPAKEFCQTFDCNPATVKIDLLSGNEWLRKRFISFLNKQIIE